MCTYLSKNGLYVLTVEQDLTYYPDPADFDTDIFIDTIDDVDVEAKLADLLGGREQYQEEHDKFDNVADLFNDLNKIGEEKGFWIVPIWQFKHDNVEFGVGTRCGWDVGTVGFASISVKDAKKNDYPNRQAWVNMIKIYLNDLTKAENGEVYDLEVLDAETNEVVNSIGAFMFNDNDLDDKKQMVQEFGNELADLGYAYMNPDFWVKAKRVAKVVTSYEFDK